MISTAQKYKKMSEMPYLRILKLVKSLYNSNILHKNTKNSVHIDISYMLVFVNTEANAMG